MFRTPNRSGYAGAVVLMMLLVIHSASAAQATAAQLTITVTDESGNPLPNAALRLVQGNNQRTFTSGTDGRVLIDNLALGEWTLTVKADKFAGKTRPLVVQANPASLSVVLEPVVARLLIDVESEVIDDSIRLNSAATGGTTLDIPIRELPNTLSIIGQELIQERGMTNSLEALELAPGVTIWNDTGWIPAADSRGFSTTDAGIFMMLDGMKQNTVPQSGRFMDTFTLERVEVLKGPASLLYGEGTIGTSINYVSKRPKHETAFDTLLSYGSFGHTRVGFGANVPFRKEVSGRVDMSYTTGGGYADRTGTRGRMINSQVRWTPLSNLTIDAMGVYSDDSVSAYYGTPLPNSPYDPAGDYIQLGPNSYLDERIRFKNYNIRDELNKSHNNRGRLSAEVLLPHGWRVSNTFGVTVHRFDNRDYEGYNFNNTTRTVTVSGYFLAKRDDVLVANELTGRKTLRILGRIVDFSATGYISDNNMHRWSTPSGAPTFSLDPINPDPIFDPGLAYVKNRDVYTVTRAVYGEMKIQLTDKLTLIGGGRIDRIDNHRFDEPAGLDTFKSYRPKTGRFGAVYAIVPNVSVFISNNRSVQPTTPLVSLGANQINFSLQPGRSWEAGVKGSFFRDRVDTALSIFSMNRKNMLTQTIVDGVRLQQQIGEQASSGYEFSFSARLRRMFSLQGDLAYTNAEYVEFNENLGTSIVARAGNDVPHTPAVVWNVTPMLRLGPVTVSSTVRTVGARWRDRANTIRLKPYTTVTGNIGIALPRGARLTLTGKNLTDELIIARSNSDSIARFSAPRNYSVQLTKTF